VQRVALLYAIPLRRELLSARALADAPMGAAAVETEGGVLPFESRSQHRSSYQILELCQNSRGQLAKKTCPPLPYYCQLINENIQARVQLIIAAHLPSVGVMLTMSMQPLVGSALHLLPFPLTSLSGNGGLSQLSYR
jgi:hypothetical protein